MSRLARRSWPVRASRARTWRTPLASIAKVTSIVVSPRGRGSRPSRISSPTIRFSSIRRDSPWQTRIRTVSCLSREVVKLRLISVGSRELRRISSSQ
jgi:hypothetical protein